VKRQLINALDLCFTVVSIISLAAVYLIGAVALLAAATSVVVLTLKVWGVLG
jgi:hypothetical protein